MKRKAINAVYIPKYILGSTLVLTIYPDGLIPCSKSSINPALLHPTIPPTANAIVESELRFSAPLSGSILEFYTIKASVRASQKVTQS